MLLAFDMEIATPVPDGGNLLEHRPGIACAGFAREGDPQPLVVFDPAVVPELFDERTKALITAGALEILDMLTAAARDGDTIITWNGAGFDFALLADQTGRRQECAILARASVDMMFQVLCERGHPLSLDAALRGMALPTKVHTVKAADGREIPIDGRAAPSLWQDGEYRGVMEYCGGDVQGTLALALACQARGRLTWISRAGQPKHLPLTHGWLTVEQCLSLPLPDTSWMSDPVRRESVVEWMDR
jgi:hypothetical protein